MTIENRLARLELKHQQLHAQLYLLQHNLAQVVAARAVRGEALQCAIDDLHNTVKFIIAEQGIQPPLGTSWSPTARHHID